MAKSNGIDVDAQCRGIIADIKGGKYAPVYLLMGEEPYYPDMVCDAILENCVDEECRDFDQFVLYGGDSDADKVITASRGYSMYGGRVLVVLKEAQQMEEIESLQYYVSNPLESTVLVILMHKASLDKRKALYKACQKAGVVVDSPEVKDYNIQRWILSYFSGRGLEITPDAAALLGEYVGTDLCAIGVETDKLLKALPEGTTKISADDVDKNVGMNRQFSVFELSKELSSKNSSKAVRIASGIGMSAKFYLPAAISALYLNFYRVLKYEALLMKNPNPSTVEKTETLGVAPFFFREYETAVRNYPLPKCMAVISLLRDYDFKGKGGEVSQDTDPGELLTELVTKILNI